ncbi:hypothetical protein B0H16DRAFT_1894857 [Mycena metata]|uniref:Uncharacterized protein n=1 Tax=Mycena metata TaxID=1033252 RepID=A0AAD7HRT4_9AGAR|nr:hypothetical protein B0H16DRAFT_1894857 [Mycena metata]
MPSIPAVFPFTPVPWLTFESQDLTLGADLFLQGVLCAQFAHYTNVNKQDSVWMKLFVAGLALLTTLKTIQVLAMISIQNVVLFESPGATHDVGGRKWLGLMNLILEACVAFYVQLFFCHRLWTLSHNVYIIIVAISLFISALVTASAAAYFASTSTRIAGHLILTHLGLATGGDLLQTGSIVFYLLSAAPGAFCALVDFATLTRSPRSGPTLAFEISIIANIMLPKLYAIAAMWTLNSRDEIRSVATRPDLPSFLEMGVGDTTAPEVPKLHAGGIDMTDASSINAPKNIQPNFAERKAWERCTDLDMQRTSKFQLSINPVEKGLLRS